MKTFDIVAYNRTKNKDMIEDMKWTGCPQKKSLAGFAILLGLLFAVILG
jgi:hypothetical protein